MRKRHGILAATLLLALGISAASAAPITFTSTLSGASESPPVVSPATGQTTVIIDPTAHTLRVITNFTGLIGSTTASHLHCCNVDPTKNSGVATTTPSFAGFPLGVQSGSMDQTYNTLLASSYNPAFVAANGGTPASAEAVLFSGILGGATYINVHTTTSPGGEIRGTLLSAPLGTGIPALSQWLLGALALVLAGGGFWTMRRRRT